MNTIEYGNYQDNFQNINIDDIIYLILINHRNGINLSVLLTNDFLNIINQRCVEIIINQKPEVWKLIPIENLCEVIRPLPIQIRNSIPNDIWNLGLVSEMIKKEREQNFKLVTIAETEELFSEIDEFISEKNTNLIKVDIEILTSADNTPISINADPIVEPVSEPDVEPVSEPVIESVSESIIEPVSEPIVESVSEPIVEPVIKIPKLIEFQLNQINIKQIQNIKDEQIIKTNNIICCLRNRLFNRLIKIHQ